MNNIKQGGTNTPQKPKGHVDFKSAFYFQKPVNFCVCYHLFNLPKGVDGHKFFMDNYQYVKFRF